tara:strand:- start:7721 stop:8938 length:1218 start_codon:yes stop_codon:yes gene_type:complete
MAVQTALTQTVIDRAKLAKRPYEIRDSRLNGFLVRVQPSGVKSFYCEYDRGKRWRLGRADSMAVGQARNQAKQIISQYHSGIDPMDEKRSNARAITLGEFIDLFFQPWAQSHQKAHEQNIKRIRTVFKGFLKRKLDDVSVIDLERWRASRIAVGNKTTTINRDIASIKAVFNRAVDFEIIEQNPIAKVKKAREDTRPRVRYLNDEELKSLFDALDRREERRCDERDSANQWRRERGYRKLLDFKKCAFTDHLKPMIVLSLHTGMRRGEVFDLKWQHVDFTVRSIAVVGETAKSGKTRHIPMNRTCLDVLVRWQKQCAKSSGRVFQNADGMRFNNVKRSWTAILKQAGIVNFRWHDMRHHFASRLAMAGVDLNAIRELLGHSDYEMTLRYAHLAPEHKRKAVELLD